MRKNRKVYILISVKLRNPNFWIFQKWAQMNSKGPMNPNWPNHCQKTVVAIICRKSEHNRQKIQNDDFEAKIRHFPTILSQNDQTLYHFQLYGLVLKSPTRTRRWSTGLVAMRQKKSNRPHNDERLLDILESLFL